MKLLPYRLSDGQLVNLRIHPRTKNSIILRRHDSGSLNVSVPRGCSGHALRLWLRGHETELLRCLKPPVPPLPEHILMQGEYLPLRRDAVRQAEYDSCRRLFRLPEHADDTACRQALAQILYRRAQAVLPEQIRRHSQRLQLYPPKGFGLSNAKTFWGVYRPQRGIIRLNWRLIGAPATVADYVCLHELCHLVHADHSRRFWQLLHRHCADTGIDAHREQQWLKQHGGSLFALG